LKTVRTVAALSRNDYPQGTSVGTSPFGGTDENGDPAGVASLTLAQTPETSIMPVQARTRGIRRGGAVSATGGQQQNTPRMPDLGLRPRPRCDTAAVDERKNGQIDDGRSLAGSGRCGLCPPVSDAGCGGQRRCRGARSKR
jgi:hypothetical protein